MLSGRNTIDRPSAFRSLDWFTVILYLILVAAGAVSIYAASYDFDHASIFSFAEFSGKQIRWIGLSIIIALLILAIDYRFYETYAYPIYVLMMLLLLVTIFVAPDIKGSHSWLKFGPISLQPAEFAKTATALALAKLFNGYNFKLNASAANYAKAIGIILLPVLLIFLQQETGSALAYLALFFVLYREGMSGMTLLAALAAVVIFVVAVKFTDSTILLMPKGEFIVLTLIMIVTSLLSGVYAKSLESLRNLSLFFLMVIGVCLVLNASSVAIPYDIVMIAAIAIGCIYLVIAGLRRHLPRLLVSALFAAGSVGFLFSVNVVFDHMAPHQQNRILVALGIKADPRGAGYNVNQSMIAIGSGGITGKGFLNGTQTKLKYVPEQHTDFIFCTIGEEEGFIGTSAVVLLFLMLILRIVNIAERQPTTFTRVYAYCVASILIFHLLINVGMVIGLCPVIGIPLPFFSYGGSSLWGFTIMLFILLRLDAARNQFRH